MATREVRGGAWPWMTSGVVTGMVGTTVIAAFLAPTHAEPAAAGPPPRFTDEAASAGIDHVYDGEFTHFVGGGVAAFDCDDDTRPDLYLAGGSNPAALYRNASTTGGALRFTPVVGASTDLAGVVGAYPLDVDGDAHTDLAVLRHGENVLLRGLGDCRFERANEAWSYDGGDAWTAAFSATWEPGASWPTVAVGNYLDVRGGGQAPRCADNALLRPSDDGAGFAAPIALSPGWCTLSILFSDWDRSGRHDLRMTNDRHYSREGRDQLWQVVAGEPPRPYTEEDGWQPLRIWGMGIASHDVTGDGVPEVLLTSQADNKFRSLSDPASGRPAYEDIAIERGVTAHRPYTGGDVLPSTAWHPQFEDVNNDGYVDLFVTKGNVEAQEGYAMRDPDNLLLGQPDGTFIEAGVEAGIATFTRSRGAAVVDLNGDGMLDLVVVNRRASVEAWRNTGTGSVAEPRSMGHWLAVRPRQSGANRDAIGAWVEVRVAGRVIGREVVVGGGHASGQLGAIHAGLGTATEAEVRVVWPDGEVGPWMAAPVDATVTVDRGTDQPIPWTPHGT